LKTFTFYPYNFINKANSVLFTVNMSRFVLIPQGKILDILFYCTI